jgi:putative PIN family toxin of toxin-antitoxin system
MTKKNIVVDTNTLLSSVLRSGSVTHQAVLLALGDFQICFSDETWNELVDVLFRPKFAKYFVGDERDALLAVLAQAGEFVTVIHSVTDCRDPKDNKFLSLALAAQALCIVSGDKDLQVLNPYHGIAIFSPAEFLNHYQP